MPNLDRQIIYSEQPTRDLVRDTQTILRYTPHVAPKKSKRGGFRPGSGRKPILSEPKAIKVSLDGETYDRLAEAAEKREISMAGLVREAVEAYFSNRRSRRGK